MRRAAIGAGVLVLAAVAAGSARWPVDAAWVADRLNAASGPTRPLTWSEPQTATVSALPWPSLRIVDAQLDSASGASVVSAPEARVDLSLVALVLGRVEPARVALAAPTITFDLDRPPFVRRLGAVDALTAITGVSSLGAVSLTDGVVRLTSRRRGLDTVIENVRGRLDSLSPNSRISLDLSAVWRDAPLALSGSLDEPQQAALGRPTALVVQFASLLGDLTFKGALTAGSTPGAAGDLSASSHAVADLLRLLGAPPLTVPGAADVAISGTIKATPKDVVFDDATVTAGGQTLQGAVRLTQAGERLSVSGSLDAEYLALAPLLGPPGPMLAPDGGWSRNALPLAPPRDFDLDLRLSAGQLDAYGVRLDDVAASTLLKDGALTTEIVEATAYGGRLSGELQVGCDTATLHLAAHGKLDGADFGAAAAGFGWPEATGDGSAEFAVETMGRSAADLIAGLGGKASLTVAEGALSAVNLEEALRRSQRRSVDIVKDARSGKTAFDKATVSVLIGQGVAHIVNGTLIAQGLRADLQGAVDLAGQSWKLRLNASQEDSAGVPPPDAAHLSLGIDGPWSNPNIHSDEDAGAAEPGPTPAP